MTFLGEHEPIIKTDTAFNCLALAVRNHHDRQNTCKLIALTSIMYVCDSHMTI